MHKYLKNNSIMKIIIFSSFFNCTQIKLYSQYYFHNIFFTNQNNTEYDTILFDLSLLEIIFAIIITIPTKTIHPNYVK